MAEERGLPLEESDNNRVDTTTFDWDIKPPVKVESRYFRLHLDAAFQEHGSQLPDKIGNATYVDRCKREDLEAFVNEFATKSEECVYETMGDCPEFVQVTNWSELMHSAGLKETCNNELALALKVIANTERFPDPKNAKGVDFALLYKNLSNMMLGHPVQQMNEATTKLLKEVYEESLAQLKQTDNNENAALLRERLQNILPPMESSYGSLGDTTLENYFDDSNLNPLQIPFDKLFSTNG